MIVKEIKNNIDSVREANNIKKKIILQIEIIVKTKV